MGRKRHESLSSIQNRDEVAVFLDHILQWLCDLQSNEIKLFDEKHVVELGQTIAWKLDLAVFCDLDRNYRNAYSINFLVNEKGRSLLIEKEADYYADLKVSQFRIRIDISHKGGFFCLRAYTVLQVDNASLCVPVQDKSRRLLKICDQVVRLLNKHGLIQIPNILLERHTNGRNELGGEVTVMTKFFGEA